MVTLTLTRLAYVGGKRWTRVEEEEEPPGHVVVVVTSSKTFVRRVDENVSVDEFAGTPSARGRPKWRSAFLFHRPESNTKQ